MSTSAGTGCPYDPLSETHRADPAATWRVLRRERPVCHDEAHDLWVLSRHADVLAAAKDTATFSNRTPASAALRPCAAAAEVLRAGPQPVETLLTVDPPEHTELRRIVDQAFKLSRVRAMEPMVRSIASELVDGLFVDGSEAEVMEALAVPLPMRVISRILGVPEQDYPTFKRWSDDIAGGLSADLSEGEQVAAARSRVEFYEFVLAECEERRRSPRDDVLTDLTTLVRDDGTRLSDGELISVAVQLLVAGNETSTNLLGSALWHLARSGWWGRLVAEPSWAPQVVEEVLRLESPVQALYRRTTAPVELHDRVIPEGSRVHLVWASANRDPEVWSDADAFDPAREGLRTHLAFGFGPHYCPGASLARLEGRVALEELVARYPRLEVDLGGAEWRRHFHLRGLLRLPVRPGPAG